MPKISLGLIAGNFKSPWTLKWVTIPVAPSVPIATAVVPKPVTTKRLEVIPALYVPSILDEVVDNPVTLIISVFIQPIGSSFTRV